MIDNSISEQGLAEPSIGYWASQEQYPMELLIEFVNTHAERTGRGVQLLIFLNP